MHALRFEDFVKEFRSAGGSTKLATGTGVLIRVGEGQLDAPARLAFRTQTAHGEVPAADGARRPISELGGVSFISKKVGAAFPDQISLGRATNTDVHLPLPGISKYHAFFSLAPGGVYTFTDVGSKNGSWVNDQWVVPKKAVRLADGDLLSIGPNDFVFHTHTGFVRLLKKESERQA